MDRSLEGWFSTCSDFAPQGTLSHTWGHFWLSQLGECYWYWVRSGQGCDFLSRHARDTLTQSCPRWQYCEGGETLAWKVLTEFILAWIYSCWLGLGKPGDVSAAWGDWHFTAWNLCEWLLMNTACLDDSAEGTIQTNQLWRIFLM